MSTTGPTSVCIVGGGASGIGLAWCLARAKQLGLATDDWQVTVLHSSPRTSAAIPTRQVTMDRQAGPARPRRYQIIAPAMYPRGLVDAEAPHFADVALDTVELRLASAFPRGERRNALLGKLRRLRGHRSVCGRESRLRDLRGPDLHRPRPPTRRSSGSSRVSPAPPQGHRGQFQDLDHFE